MGVTYGMLLGIVFAWGSVCLKSLTLGLKRLNWSDVCECIPFFFFSSKKKRKES